MALNYVAAQGLLRNASGRVDGVTLRNELDGESLDAARPRRWSMPPAPGWTAARGGRPRAHASAPCAAATSWCSAQRLPVAEALTLFHPRDRRAIFVFPWEGCTVIGTTDLDHRWIAGAEPAISRQEVDYLLQAGAPGNFPVPPSARPTSCRPGRVCGPCISKDRSKDPSREKRDHKVWVDQGLISVSGGKLTTFRLIALDTLRAARPFLHGQAMSNTEEWVLEPACIAPSSLAVPTATGPCG